MDEINAIKNEPELNLLDVEYIGVEPEDISNLLINQEYEFGSVDESDRNATKNLAAKASLKSKSDDLTCTYCGKILSTKQSLRGHLRTHNGQYYKCEYIGCTRKFTRKIDLKYHTNTHTGKELFKCPVCPKTYPRKSLLRTHEQSHEIEPEPLEPWEEMPIKQYLYGNEISSHTKKNHDESSYAESNQKLECNEDLPSEHNLDNNLRGQSFQFDCNICNLKFSKKSYFDLHLISHLNEHQVKQHTITKATETETNSQNISEQNFQISEVRINEMSYQCYCCRQAFREKEHLEEHMKVHSEIIICGWCDEKFPTRIIFKNHLPCNKSPNANKKTKRNVAKPQDLHCSYCSKKFRSIYKLTVHKKMHNLHRQWCCRFCGLRFKKNKTLEEHLRIHQGIKLFECKICERKFTQSSTLWRHNKSIH